MEQKFSVDMFKKIDTGEMEKLFQDAPPKNSAIKDNKPNQMLKMLSLISDPKVLSVITNPKKIKGILITLGVSSITGIITILYLASIGLISLVEFILKHI